MPKFLLEGLNLYTIFIISSLVLKSPIAQAFTLEIFSSQATVGWKTNALSFDVDYTNCPSQDLVNAALDSAMSLWNTVPTTSLVVSRGASISTSPAVVSISPHVAGNPQIVCDPNFSTTLGQSGIQDVSPAVSLNGNADGTGKITYYAILLNVQSGAKSNISNFNSALLTVILAHEMGHVLGLGHSADINALMYYNASAKVIANLAQDDVDGLTYLYPRDEPVAGGAFGCGSLQLVGNRNSSKPSKNQVGPSKSNAASGWVEFVLILSICLFRVWIEGCHQLKRPLKAFPQGKRI